MTTKLDVKDAHELDERIPKNLIMKYQNQYYILYPGLLWKLNKLYGTGNYGITTEIVERKPDYVLVKATLKLSTGMEFSNFGESSNLNVTNPMMKKYLLHLAITRATCRVARMASASGYASYEEVVLGNENGKELPVSDKDNEPATEAQKSTIKSLKGELSKEATQGEAKAKIAELVQK